MAPGAVLLLLLASACGEAGRRAEHEGSTGVGPDPRLPEPSRRLLPQVHIAPAQGWGEGASPQAAPGLSVSAFARDLDHPRWLHVLPNGDVLVAETNAPARPGGGGGIRGWLMGLAMKRAGAASPSADRITLLRDGDHDGVAEQRTVLLSGLHSPFGMALVGDTLFVANTDAVLAFPYQPGDTRITAPGRELLALPAGPINHHWTKNLIASADGSALYVTVGSNSNAGERGLDAEAGRAAIWRVDLRDGRHAVFASGLRNPNGLAWAEGSGALWTVVNERDELGDDLVPDYLTSVQAGGFYGWPWSYYGQHLDPRVRPQRPDLVATALKPDYALGSHVAPLGLASAAGNTLPAMYAEGMFIGEHGSWNRKPRSGYKVVFVPFRGGRPGADAPVDVLTGFVGSAGKAFGRPVGVAIDARGGLLVADDVGNVVWRVAAAR